MKNLTFLLIACISFATVNAQKLPNVQQASLRAPANVKVDGKDTEWEKMQAYNSAADVYYTIANDDKKLYLVVQAKTRDNMLRLVNGGVTLLIQKTGSKNDIGAVGAKFPYLEKGQRIGIPVLHDFESGKGGQLPEQSIINAVNKTFASKLKWIFAKALIGKDGPLPVYNDEGLQAAVAISDKGVYTSELAIDLSLLSIPAGGKFAYHIVINGEPNKYTENFEPEKWNAVRADGSGTPVTEAELQAGRQKVAQIYAVAYSTTDFWGEYTLAK